MRWINIIAAEMEDFDTPIIFTISETSPETEWAHCLILTEDSRVSEDKMNASFSSDMVNVMTKLSKKYTVKGYTVLFKVD